MKKTKKQLNDEVIGIIEKIETNTFLFPKSFSEKVIMSNEDWTYKTYNSGDVGKRRYHSVTIFKDDEEILEIGFQKNNKIQVVQDMDKKAISSKDIHYYMKSIFDEMHSFKNHSEGKRKIRKEITHESKKIREAKERILELKNRLEDFKKL